MEANAGHAPEAPKAAGTQCVRDRPGEAGEEEGGEEAMTEAGDIPDGAVIHLDCGCMGYRSPSPPEGPVMLIICRACHEHADRGLCVRYVDATEHVSPFVRPYC